MLPRDHVLQAVKRLRWLTGEYQDRLSGVAGALEDHKPKLAMSLLLAAQRFRRENEPRVLEDCISHEQELAKLIETLGGSDAPSKVNPGVD